MNYVKLPAAMALAILLGACADVPATMNAPMANISPISDIALGDITDTIALNGRKKSETAITGAANWHVRAVRVNVPESLTVTEADGYVPRADIVWREDPYGDRRAQVRTIVTDAVAAATADLHGAKAVYLDIEMKRFHALSQKARATVGGFHNVRMELSVRDAASGTTLAGPVLVAFKMKAFGGQQAIDAEIRGETQKVRIKREIVTAMRASLGM